MVNKKLVDLNSAEVLKRGDLIYVVDPTKPDEEADLKGELGQLVDLIKQEIPGTEIEVIDFDPENKSIQNIIPDVSYGINYTKTTNGVELALGTGDPKERALKNPIIDSVNTSYVDGVLTAASAEVATNGIVCTVFSNITSFSLRANNGFVATMVLSKKTSYNDLMTSLSKPEADLNTVIFVLSPGNFEYGLVRKGESPSPTLERVEVDYRLTSLSCLIENGEVVIYAGEHRVTVDISNILEGEEALRGWNLFILGAPDQSCVLTDEFNTQWGSAIYRGIDQKTLSFKLKNENFDTVPNPVVGFSLTKATNPSESLEFSPFLDTVFSLMLENENAYTYTRLDENGSSVSSGMSADTSEFLSIDINIEDRTVIVNGTEVLTFSYNNVADLELTFFITHLGGSLDTAPATKLMMESESLTEVVYADAVLPENLTNKILKATKKGKILGKTILEGEYAIVNVADNKVSIIASGENLEELDAKILATVVKFKEELKLTSDELRNLIQAGGQSFKGVFNDINQIYVPDAKMGDYVIIGETDLISGNYYNNLYVYSRGYWNLVGKQNYVLSSDFINDDGYKKFLTSNNLTQLLNSFVNSEITMSNNNHPLTIGAFLLWVERTGVLAEDEPATTFVIDDVLIGTFKQGLIDPSLLTNNGLLVPEVKTVTTEPVWESGYIKTVNQSTLIKPPIETKKVIVQINHKYGGPYVGKFKVGLELPDGSFFGLFRGDSGDLGTQCSTRTSGVNATTGPAGLITIELNTNLTKKSYIILKDQDGAHITTIEFDAPESIAAIASGLNSVMAISNDSMNTSNTSIKDIEMTVSFMS